MANVENLAGVPASPPAGGRLRDEPAPTHDTTTPGSHSVDRARHPADRARPRSGPRSELLAQLRWPLAVYLGSRLLYLAIALADTRLQGWSVHHWSLASELRNWDGSWYLGITYHGYPGFVSHAETRLGFFPLYPLLVWGLAQVIPGPHLIAGTILALLTGASATVLIGRLAARWWGETTARRAVLFFCLFPGSIVFSMVYTEGLLLTLVAGSLLALERRRWLLAGALAGCATAVGPVAVAIIPACGVAALLEIRRRGWRERSAWRALAAPLLAPAGLVAFGAYLWIHAGSPFASYTAQRYGWKESSTPLALVRVATSLYQQLTGPHSWQHPGVNLNLVAGLAGAVFLASALVMLWRERRRVPAAAVVWTAGMAVLTVTSANVPPNARMLICAFPAVIVYAQRLRGRAFAALIASSTVLLVVMSAISLVGNGLRP